MKIEQEPTAFEDIFIVLETPKDANNFRDMIQGMLDGNLSQENLELGQRVIKFFESTAVVPEPND